MTIPIPQFGQGASWSNRNHEKAKWFPNYEGIIQPHFAEINWDEVIIIAHNAMFDGAILSWRYGIKPRMIVDTMSMSRAIDGVGVRHSLRACAERYGLGEKGTEVLNALGKQLNDSYCQELWSLKLHRYV